MSIDELARLRAKKLLVQALDLEVEQAIESQAHLKNLKGHRLVVRNGKAKSRTITIGSGSFGIKVPRVQDRRPNEFYKSKLLPP